jgi:hypothetical protein
MLAARMPFAEEERQSTMDVHRNHGASCSVSYLNSLSPRTMTYSEASGSQQIQQLRPYVGVPSDSDSARGCTHNMYKVGLTLGQS